LNLSAAFTYGKVISDSDSYLGATVFQDAANRRLDRGLTNFDTPKRLSVVGFWELPFLRGNQTAVGKLLGGWQLSGMAILEAGNPITITTGAPYPRGDYNADGTNFDRPNAPDESVKRSGFERSDYLQGIFKVSDFPIPTAGTNGTLGRSTFRGPGFAQVDLSLMKKFPITEKVTSELRLEAYNALNRVNLSNVTTDLNSNTFGRSTQVFTPRQLQIALRVRF
jgi:hypothetical protein